MATKKDRKRAKRAKAGEATEVLVMTLDLGEMDTAAALRIAAEYARVLASIFGGLVSRPPAKFPREILAAASGVSADIKRIAEAAAGGALRLRLVAEDDLEDPPDRRAERAWLALVNADDAPIVDLLRAESRERDAAREATRASRRAA